MYAETFDKVIAATASLKTKVPKMQVAAIKTKFLPVLEKKAQETKGETRKAFEKAYNLFSSLKDGVQNNEVKASDFADAIVELQGLRKAVARAEKAPVKKETSAEQTLRDDSISDSGQGRNAILQDKGLLAMKKYDKFKGLVPSQLPEKKRYVAIKLPIVAVTDPLLVKDRLAQFGLCDDTIFGYPFLKNQTLIGLSKAWVMSEFKGQTPPAIEFLLELLKDKTGKSYHLLGSSKMRGQVSWVWVASAKEMAIMNRVAGGGHFKVIGWDFPFEVDQKRRK